MDFLRQVNILNRSLAMIGIYRSFLSNLNNFSSFDCNIMLRNKHTLVDFMG
jgi:hypothetical protein